MRRDQWRLLICEPLSKLEAGSLQQPLILVIDALDECDGDNDIREILDLLSEAKVLKTVRLRIFVTSRLETPIRLGFREMPGILHQDLILHEIPRATVDVDILTFFKYKFGVIRKKSDDDLPPNWPGQNSVDKLVSSSHGLFIYAATVCRFIEEGIQNFSADSLLRLVLPDEGVANTSSQVSKNINTNKSPTKELDMVYTQVLEHSLKNCPEEDKEQLAAISRQVVGAIVILFDPLSAIAIIKLLDKEKWIIKKRLNHLRSVLEVPDSEEYPIRLLHPSFRDFLLNDKRCSSQQFWVGEKKANGALANCCVQLMSRQLRKDICNLHALDALAMSVQGDKIKHHLPAELQYACLYWVQHLQRSERVLSDHGLVHVFLCEHLLHWFEALSLIGRTSEGVCAIALLESIVKVSII